MQMGLVLLALGLAASSAQYCEVDSQPVGDKWVIVDPSTGDQVIAASGVPALPAGTRSVSYGVKHGALQGYDGTIVIGGPLSLSPSDGFYSYATLMWHSLEIFADLVNYPTSDCVHKDWDGECAVYGLGGIRVGAQRMALRFEWAGDASSVSQVTNATLQATRGACADFTIAGYASSLTKYTAQQSFYDNRVMVAPAAAATSVYTQEINGSVSNLSFGLAIPAGQYHRTALDLVRSPPCTPPYTDSSLRAGAQRGVRVYTQESPCTLLHDLREHQVRAAAAQAGPAEPRLVLGFVQAEGSFHTTMCTGAIEYATELGMAIAAAARP